MEQWPPRLVPREGPPRRAGLRPLSSASEREVRWFRRPVMQPRQQHCNRNGLSPGAFRWMSPATRWHPPSKGARDDERGARQRATPAWEERESLERGPPVDIDWWPLFMDPMCSWDHLKSCDRARSTSASRCGGTSIQIHHCWSSDPHARASAPSPRLRPHRLR